MMAALRILGPALFALGACGGGTGDAGADETGSGDGDVVYALDGHAQKGPFINGSSITVNELGADLVATGRVFNTSIADDTGVFSLPSVTLESGFVQLSTDGFYFDEVAGELSAARLELRALADVSNETTVNVNLLGHLERSRVEYLLTQGQTFVDAKAQAQNEVLAIFEIDGAGAANSEMLDISQAGDDNAKLLAISAILQGRRTVAELSELLSAIATDIRQDGVLDSAISGSALMNGAVLLDLASVRSNLETRYGSLGVAHDIGDFESHVLNFTAVSDFEFTDVIEYPESGEFGTNILDPNTTNYVVAAEGASFSLAADLPRGTSLTVKMSWNGPFSVGGTPENPEGDTMNLWSFSDPEGWEVSSFDFDLVEQDFIVLEDDAIADMQLDFMSGAAGTADVLYFENGSETLTATKTITWGP